VPQLAGAIIPVYLGVVSPLENIVEDLKSLPPARLEVAADLVHRLRRISEDERQAILARTAGALSQEEAGELERVIEEGCEKIDEHGW
jgi:DNA-directed RNA polymerase specialized sigma24 family protein